MITLDDLLRARDLLREASVPLYEGGFYHVHLSPEAHGRMTRFRVVRLVRRRGRWRLVEQNFMMQERRRRP